MSNKYRFFELKMANNKEDYCRAEYLSEARKIFKRVYPNLIDYKIKEVFMSNFNKKNKSWGGDK